LHERPLHEGETTNPRAFKEFSHENIQQGIVPPTNRRFNTKLENDQIESIVVEQLAALYQNSIHAGVPEDFKLDTADNKQLLNALITVVDEAH
jgi:hypothetical protein